MGVRVGLTHHAVALLLEHGGAELALVDRGHKSRAPEGQRTAALRLPHVRARVRAKVRARARARVRVTVTVTVG